MHVIASHGTQSRIHIGNEIHMSEMSIGHFFFTQPTQPIVPEHEPTHLLTSEANCIQSWCGTIRDVLDFDNFCLKRLHILTSFMFITNNVNMNIVKCSNSG